ncbi:MAG: CvpA family protein [Zoogloeaceae bacterium]|jgi:membrane protein required for colicin V production|nr:CvpA family protein [Zoogloeaceae bacterium]
MTLFDYGVIAIVGASLLLGLWRGVVGELIALAAWVLAFFAARAFGPEAGASFFTGIADSTLRLLAGYVAVFAGVLVLMALGRLAVSSMVRALGLSASDRLLGVLFGMARGLLITLALVALGGMTSLPRQDWWARAQLAPPLETAVLALKPWLPGEIAKRIKFR